MQRTDPRKGTALVVAVGLLAVLSAMAFTFVTVMKVEMEVSSAQKTSVQTGMLDQWAVQAIVDHLTREPLEGAMYTPVDWAGEEWCNRLLIQDSPFMPDGGMMSFAVALEGKGNFTIVARTLDCSSMVNLADAEDITSNEKWDKWKMRKISLLRFLPFDTEKDEPLGEAKADELLEAVREIRRGNRGGETSIPTKESLLPYLMASRPFRKLASDPTSGYSPEEAVALLFLGERGPGGDITRVGFKDFITLDSHVDSRMLDITLTNPHRRAPININTAPSWLLKGLLVGIASNEGVTIEVDDAEELTDYILAYRTPKKFLPPKLKSDLRSKQDDLVNWIKAFTDNPASDDTFPPDPTSENDLKAQLERLAHLLINPEFDVLIEQMEGLGLNPQYLKPKNLPDKDTYNKSSRLPRPFASWAQFDAFLKLLVYKGKLGGDITVGRKKARAIMANCNPNTSHSVQPIRNGIAQWNCGKDKLGRATTEFCFGSFGRFEIEMIVGRVRKVAGGTPLAIPNFPGDRLDTFQGAGIQIDKLRTIDGSVYAPDRLSFYRESKLLMTRSIEHTSGTNTVHLKQEVSPLAWSKPTSDKAGRLSLLIPPTPPNPPTRWSIERLEATKKWNTVVKFADVIRLDTVADFQNSENENRSGTGSGALYYPKAEGKKLESGVDLDDDKVNPTEKDGSISMRTQAPEDDNKYHLEDTFTNGQQTGASEDRPPFGPVFANGVWIKWADALKYQSFHDVFPKKPTGKGAMLQFAIGMWICLNKDNVNGTIINTSGVKVGSVKNPIVFKIDDRKLQLDLLGAVGGKGGEEIRITGAGSSPISVAGWQPGQWHWIGFTFREAVGDNSEATIFASYLDTDGDLQLKTSRLGTFGERMFLYDKVSRGSVAFGTIDAVVDDILVTTENDRILDPELFMPETRFKKGSYKSPKTVLSLLDDEKETPVEFGTISWTQSLTTSFLPAGKRKFDEKKDDYSDAYVSANKGLSTVIGSTAGRINYKKDEYDPRWEIPVWFSHDDILGKCGKIGRIGMGGEGQRMGGESIPPVVCWTGYVDPLSPEADDGPGINENGKAGDRVYANIRLIGPHDNPNPNGNSNEEEPNLETPHIEDVTITYFKGLEVLYWKLASDPTE